MAFLLNGQPISAGRSFVDADGNQYPNTWTSVLSQEQKDALGIVWVPDPEPVDTRFYWDHNLPKNLEDLKTQWIAQQKEIAASLFAPTDWYIIRKVDTGIDIPASVQQYRDNVRLTSGLREDQINQAATFETFVALVTNPSTVYDEATQTQVPNTEPNLLPWPESPFTTN
jgi:hypothetical protein